MSPSLIEGDISIDSIRAIDAGSALAATAGMLSPKLIDPELPVIGGVRRTPACIGPAASILLPDAELTAMKAGMIIVKSRPAEATIGNVSEVSNREWALASA